MRSLLADGVAQRCTIVACGERWTPVSDEPDSLPPSIEDLIGAGSIVAAPSDLRTSPEAGIAAAAFDASEHRILDVLRIVAVG